MRSSLDWVRDGAGKWQRVQLQRTRGLNLTHNHQLKAIFKGAATSVLMQWHEDPLYQDYQRLLAGGTKAQLGQSHAGQKDRSHRVGYLEDRGGVPPGQAPQAAFTITRRACWRSDV